MLPIEEILDALDLSQAEPGIGFLAALFDRFNARVPFETATKILRNQRVTDPEGKPRRADTFWKDHLERGAGGTCFARVAAFETLLTALGFEARKVLGRVERDLDHAALLVSQGQKVWICDVGYPLPALVPAAAGQVETALGTLAVSKTERGFQVQFLEGVPEGPRDLEIFAEPVAEGEFEAGWQATFRSGSRFLSSVALRRQTTGRVLSFARGQLRVDDRHTRLVVPLTEDRPGRLAAIFEIDRALLEEAFTIVGDPAPKEQEARLTAYLESAAAPQEAFAAIASLPGYRRLLEGVARIESEETRPGGWRLVLCSPLSEGASDPQAALTEEVTLDPEKRELRIRRLSESAEFRSAFRAEERSGKTYLVREAPLEGSREDLLSNDSLRGRLAGMLAVDLLAWARRIGRP
jgi:hypothetical protein